MLFAKNKVLRKQNIYLFWLSLPKTKIIWFFNLLTEKGYSRNASWKLCLIFHFFLSLAIPISLNFYLSVFKYMY